MNCCVCGKEGAVLGKIPKLSKHELTCHLRKVADDKYVHEGPCDVQYERQKKLDDKANADAKKDSIRTT